MVFDLKVLNLSKGGKPCSGQDRRVGVWDRGRGSAVGYGTHGAAPSHRNRGRSQRLMGETGQACAAKLKKKKKTTTAKHKKTQESKETGTKCNNDTRKTEEIKTKPTGMNSNKQIIH